MKNYRFHILLLGFLLAAALAAVGCASCEAPMTTSTPQESDAGSTDAILTPEALDAAPLSTAERDFAASPVVESYCVSCHTDQQALIDTAKPEEKAVQENEGEG